MELREIVTSVTGEVGYAIFSQNNLDFIFQLFE